MRNVKYITVLGFLFFDIVYGQNSGVDSFAMSSVPRTSEFRKSKISNDGTYSLSYFPSQTELGDTVILDSKVFKWKKQWLNVSEAVFTSDSKGVVLKTESDSLIYFNLSTREPILIGMASSFELLASKEQDWMLYYPVDLKGVNGIAIRNLKTMSSLYISNIAQYLYYPKEKAIIELLTDQKGGDNITSIVVLRLDGLWGRIIWRGKDILAFGADIKRGEMAFVNLNSDDKDVDVSYYRFGRDSSVSLADSKRRAFLMKHVLNMDKRNPPIFDDNGKKIYFVAKERQGEESKNKYSVKANVHGEELLQKEEMDKCINRGYYRWYCDCIFKGIGFVFK